ncbi:MAG: quinol oxidase [Rhodoferax sp.]|nr:quinol oxidase [Rhodoferax sp.]
MKYFAIFFLLWSGFFGASAGWAEEAPPDDAYQATVGSDGVQHVSMLGGNYFFRPKRIIVKANVPVELEVSLEQGMIPHTLVITAPEAGIAVDEKLSTEVKKIRFTPSAAGKYPFYCRNKLLFFESHRQKGMEGMLEVAL